MARFLHLARSTLDVVRPRQAPLLRQPRVQTRSEPEGVLDQVTVPVAAFVVGDRAFARHAPGDDRDGVGPADGSPQSVGVVPLVGEHVAGGACVGEEPGGDGDVGDVAWGKRQRERSANDVGEDVDLGRLAAARRTDGLRPRPPFPPKADRCALM